MMLPMTATYGEFSKFSNYPSVSTRSQDSEGGCRPTFYMSIELLSEIEDQSAAEGNKRDRPSWPKFLNSF